MKIGGRVAVNPVTDGAGSGFRKDGGTHASLVCHQRFAASCDTMTACFHAGQS